MRTVKPKLDIVFKLVFATKENEDILRGFLADMLLIKRGEIGTIIVEDPEEQPEEERGKLCRLDLKVTIDGKIVNIELQVKPEEYFGERSLFYWARMYTGSLKSGDGYGRTRECVSINILGFNMFDCEEYCSEFGLYERNRRELLTDRLKMYFYELPKLGRQLEDDDPRWLWLKFINSESEEELNMIDKTTKEPEIKKATMIIRKLSADEKERRRIERYEDSLHDDATLRDSWVKEGRKELMNELIASGLFDPAMLKNFEKGNNGQPQV